ncbi:outer membrane lipoprotein chaperone LolA [Litorivivens lipolytica]|nr:outer membrane lipoprotein chaperone LolA [Litorivivens lipolytica]
MPSKTKAFICAIALLSLAALAQAGSGGAEQLAGYLQSVQNLKAGFTQTVRDDRGEILEESRGSMTFKRPDKLRWEVAEPYRYQVITDGETLWRYDPDFEELVTEPFDRVSQTPIMILAASAEELTADYEVRLVAGTEVQRFSLKPRQANADFSELELNFKGEVLQSMLLRDKLGQTTLIELTDPRINAPTLPAELFVFRQNS